MAFSIYPDADTAALLGKPGSTPISLAGGEAMRKFVPLANHVGVDPMVGNAPTTTFICIAMSGDAVQVAQPKFELLAHDPDLAGGSPAPPLDPNTNISLRTAVPLFDDVNATGAALAYFSPPFRNNVYLLKVVFEIAGTRLWIRITNSTQRHDQDPRSFVWVVADNDADTRQPWIHATFHGAAPIDIKFDDLVEDQTQEEIEQPVEIGNFGTGPFTVGSVTPPLPAPYSISGLPVTLDPNTTTLEKVKILFEVPKETPGDIPQQAFSFVTGNKVDAGPFGPGHNNQFVLSAHTQLAAPSFDPSPHQFDPIRGQPGINVRLFGESFDLGNASVHFGAVAAASVVTNQEQILAIVPHMPPGSVKIKVETAGGSVISTDEFFVPPLPVVDSMDPDSGRPGDVFSIFGSDFITQAGDTVDVIGVPTPDQPSPPDIGSLTIVGTPTATQINLRVPPINRAIKFLIVVSRSDGEEAQRNLIFHIIPP